MHGQVKHIILQHKTMRDSIIDNFQANEEGLPLWIFSDPFETAPSVFGYASMAADDYSAVKFSSDALSRL